MSSFREGCPLVVLESLASQVPVVSTEIGGVRDIIEHGQNGMLFRLGDITQFKEHLQFLIDHPEERARMGRNGLETILQKFSRDKVMERYEEIYERVRKK
jgi:glycosyltransferase involved in cell wall biosynthesis